MNFWRNLSLKAQSRYILVILSAFFIAGYFIVRNKLQSLTEGERKIDFARSVQVQNQQITLQTEFFLQGRKELGTEVVALLDHQDHLLKTLRDGGRMEGTNLFIEPLSRLPRITLDNLEINWITYKAALKHLVTEEEVVKQPIPQIAQTDTTSLGDSTRARLPEPITLTTVNEPHTKAKIIFESQWLSLSKWYNTLIFDLEEEVRVRQSAALNWFTALILLNIAGLALVFVFFNRHVLRPLALIKTNTASRTPSNVTTNEIGLVAEQINDTLEDLRDATDFVIAIGEGKLDIDYRSLDKHYAGGNNILADSLIGMQARLKALNEEEGKRQWANEGLAKFVDILRSSNDDLTLLGDKIIAALVQYTSSNQGSLYILNDEDASNKHLELIALFAFDTKKFIQQKIKLGEGILGQTYLEKETNYLTNLPEDYIRITSGLGDANPKSILIVPLKVDTQVYGMIELASFNAYLPHEIAFVEKLGESIASTLASVRSAQRNRQLIQQFQQQTEEMRAQEEEMRQNMEELQATQEEISRKEKNYLVRIQELENQKIIPSNKEVEEFTSKEREYQLKIEELSRKLTEKPAQGDDWEVALEVEKALRINLQALELTQEELDRRRRQ
jgi:GAF domain-containing protein